MVKNDLSFFSFIIFRWGIFRCPGVWGGGSGVWGGGRRRVDWRRWRFTALYYPPQQVYLFVVLLGTLLSLSMHQLELLLLVVDHLFMCLGSQFDLLLNGSHKLVTHRVYPCCESFDNFK